MALFAEKLKKDLFDLGFSVLDLNKGELEIIHTMIERRLVCLYKEWLRENPEEIKDFYAREHEFMEIYHLIVSDDFHNSLNKKKRTLPEDHSLVLNNISIISKIRAAIGECQVSDEHAWGYPEYYFRIVRPNAASDVGPIHTDGAFWDLHKEWLRPVGYQEKRLKVWIPVQFKFKKSGLAFIPRSHETNFEITHEVRHNDIKPRIKGEDTLEKQLIYPKMATGSAIVFSDNVVHKGMITQSQYSRISLEFTLFIKE